jgi:TatD DNase family protein
VFDAHTHLQSPLLSGVLARVIDDAARAGVTGVCCCATMPDDWSAVAELARARLPFVLVPAFGVHPWHVQGLPADWPDRLAALLDAHPVAAVVRSGWTACATMCPQLFKTRCSGGSSTSRNA